MKTMLINSSLNDEFAEKNSQEPRLIFKGIFIIFC